MQTLRQYFNNRNANIQVTLHTITDEGDTKILIYRSPYFMCSRYLECKVLFVSANGNDIIIEENEDSENEIR